MMAIYLLNSNKEHANKCHEEEKKQSNRRDRVILSSFSPSSSPIHSFKSFTNTINVSEEKKKELIRKFTSKMIFFFLKIGISKEFLFSQDHIMFDRKTRCMVMKIEIL